MLNQQLYRNSVRNTLKLLKILIVQCFSKSSFLDTLFEIYTIEKSFPMVLKTRIFIKCLFKSFEKILKRSQKGKNQRVSSLVYEQAIPMVRVDQFTRQGMSGSIKPLQT